MRVTLCRDTRSYMQTTAQQRFAGPHRVLLLYLPDKLWLKFPHSALHFHIRKCFRARKCHRGREYYSTQRKSNLPGREWNSATRGIGNETRGAYRKLDGDEWRRQEALATNVGTED